MLRRANWSLLQQHDLEHRAVVVLGASTAAVLVAGGLAAAAHYAWLCRGARA